MRKFTPALAVGALGAFMVGRAAVGLVFPGDAWADEPTPPAGPDTGQGVTPAPGNDTFIAQDTDGTYAASLAPDAPDAPPTLDGDGDDTDEGVLLYDGPIGW